MHARYMLSASALLVTTFLIGFFASIIITHDCELYGALETSLMTSYVPFIKHD